MTRRAALGLAGVAGAIGIAAGGLLWHAVGAELWLAGSLPFCG